MQKTGSIVFTALLLLMVLSGCLKWYCCGNTIYYYKCTRGANSTYVAITGPPGNPQTNITDSLNVYIDQGYVCGFVDTTGPYSNCVQGEMHKKAAEAKGEACINSDQSVCNVSIDPQCGN